ncbi:hypothetical protein [Robiginitalea aurantiaca]|uniref:HEPN domain-containing protein n=1 Tax=Robiginitalea aurantiaca TaxID=3056915 RepID=A0ABT7WIF2_9FLAO|nr:hypothetical protein [Robiginitalea aurantiaca]MDM9632704.1 hypothetical protein [Robiginitalea aurantiaca]
MDTNQIKAKFEEANQHLAAAKSELNRPAEDVVPFMVCRSTRYSISNYLEGFLLQNSVEFEEGTTVEDLLKKCRAIDGTFNSVDLSPITFSKDDEYSALFDQMQNCIDLAEQAKELVIK